MKSVTLPPVAPIRPTELTLHGETRMDPYYWMRDRTNPEVIAHLERENAYTDAAMAPAAELREQLYREILGRIRQTDESVPERRGPYFYYTRTEEGREYAIHCRRADGPDAPEEVLLDENELAQGHAYFRLGVYRVSPDHRLLAFAVDTAGDEVFTIRVRDLATGALLDDTISGAYYSLEWANDNRTFFYNAVDASKRPFQLLRHSLGESGGTLVFHEQDERFNLELRRSKTGRYLFLDLSSHTTSEFHALDADTPGGAFRVIIPRRQDVEYEPVHHGASFYLRINDAGRNFRLLRVPAAAPGIESAEEVVPHRREVALEAVDAFRDHLVLLERADGLRRIVIEHLATGSRHSVAFEEPAYTVSLASNPEFDSAELRFTYSSLVTPPTVFDYEMNTRARRLRKQTEVLGGYDASAYSTERISARSHDGVAIPISLVYRNSTPRDGSAPLLLYGYGAYGITTDPGFAPERLSLLDRGFIYAIAHIRGSGDLGRYWYEDGKLQHKPNTFRDFIAAAEHLTVSGYTSSERFAIMGRSAGGLLIGAVLNLRPDLFGAAIAGVPFVDVLTTMLDPTLPLTITEYEEWGNPNEPEAYRTIRAYSPYDNVQPARYPHLLVTAGLNDPRVSYWEPAKWVARLRTLDQDGRLLLLKTNMGGGHFGPSGRYERYRESAFDYAFLLLALGVG